MLEIIEKCRKAKFSEVKTYLMWKCSEVKQSEVNEAKWIWMRWSEVQYREGARGGGNESLWNRFLGVVCEEKWKTGAKAWVK